MRKLMQFLFVLAITGTAAAGADDADWVEKSNEHAKLVLEVLAKFSPEGAGRLGVDGLDEEILDLIVNDVAVGEAWAQNEVERYTYRIPGQATAYYYGYSKMQALRAQTELKLRERFDQKAYHDFILAQGMLPPDILKDAVMSEFVPSQRD